MQLQIAARVLSLLNPRMLKGTLVFTIPASLRCLQGEQIQTFNQQALSFRCFLSVYAGQSVVEKLKDLCEAGFDLLQQL